MQDGCQIDEHVRPSHLRVKLAEVFRNYVPFLLNCERAHPCGTYFHTWGAIRFKPVAQFGETIPSCKVNEPPTGYPILPTILTAELTLRREEELHKAGIDFCSGDECFSDLCLEVQGCFEVQVLDCTSVWQRG
jgi:hypothetical protein